MTVNAHPVTWGEWPGWLDRAERDGITPACRGVDTDLFFPSGRPGWRIVEQIQEAKAVCAICPLQDVCREWAYGQRLDSIDGIWGGTTQREREERARFLRQEERERRANSTQAVDGEECAVE